MSNTYDLIIIGAGPAGLSAAIYAGRSKLKTLVLDAQKSSGQIHITSEVVNYPGIKMTSGSELIQTMREQAESFHVELKTEQVISINVEGVLKSVKTAAATYETVAVILATGAKPRSLGFKGEDTFKGHGVGYCATCDGEFFTGKDVFVIGAGFAACEEAIFLTRYARKVYLIAREPEFTCSPTIGDKVKANSKIEIHFNTEITELGGDSVPRFATFINNQTQEHWEYRVDTPKETFGVFVFVGYQPINALFKDMLDVDSMGYLIADDLMQTKVNGIYGAGDIRPKRLRQLVTAISDGAIAATEAEHYITETKEEHKIVIETEQNANAQSKPSFFDDALKDQVKQVFDRFQNDVTVEVTLSDNQLSQEAESFISDLAALSSKIKLIKTRSSSEINTPKIELFDQHNQAVGITYYGVPSGHEFNSIILALYNIAGPGQAIDDAQLSKIKALPQSKLQIGMSLTCTLCPTVVQAAQVLALNNPEITVEVIDISKFNDFKEEHTIMSVPAIVLNETVVDFGKKELNDLITMIQTTA